MYSMGSDHAKWLIIFGMTGKSGLLLALKRHFSAQKGLGKQMVLIHSESYELLKVRILADSGHAIIIFKTSKQVTKKTPAHVNGILLL